MADIRYTDEQRAVLAAEGRIIVSASAGSGKTFVMIERMLEKILAGADIDRMLALTFTKKAAAQMREKISRRLIARLNEPGTGEEERARLKNQLSRLPMAEISTIHSFCSRLIRSDFFLADVDGSFEVMAEDDADGKSLQAQALDGVFSDAYEAGDADFLELLSLYYRKKKDAKLKEILLDLYRKLRVRADYRDVLARAGAGEGLSFGAIADELLARTQRECAYIGRAVEGYLPELEALGNKSTAELIVQMLSFIREVCAAKDYFAFCALPVPAFKRKESIRAEGRGREREIIEKVAFYRAALGDVIKENLGGAVSARETEEARCLQARQTAARLAEFLRRFDARYEELKRERGKLDYNDLEHIALRLLSVPRVAAETRARFDYVFVDEYQDINPVQERIISLVGGENVFLVGDVKQSIYAFRGSKSVYFTQKQAEFSAAGHSLFLTSNFRSADAVLSAVNRVFGRTMTKELCGIDYAARPMRGGEGYAGNPGRVAVHLVAEEKEEPRERGVYSVLEAYEAARGRAHGSAQAREILDIIEEELHGQIYDPDEKKFRPVRYGDIAVLSRKKEGAIAEIAAYLSENGIPVSAAAKTDICAFPEIRQVTDILSLIDNREQDVPLCSALLSAMGGLDNAELAAIRLRYSRRREPFRRCVRRYAEDLVDGTAQKLKNFFARLEKYVVLSHVLNAGELIERLIAETGTETDWLSRTDGARRLARLRAFALQAQDRNVHEFLVWLKSLEYRVPVGENAGDDAVKVLTMHASKGLEYPVVILTDLDAPFHGADRGEVSYSEAFGIAPKCYDGEKRLVYDTLLRRLIRMEEREEERKSELNILYVAMTRAKYSLHLVRGEKDAAKHSDPFYAKNYAALLPLDCFEGQVAPPYAARAPFERRQILVTGGSEELTEKIVRSFRPAYPHAAATELPVKTSASGILQAEGAGEEYYAVHRLVEETEEGEGAADKTLVGTAYHAFLQYADFSADGAQELERLLRRNLLTAEQGKLISAKKAREILSMPVFRRLKDAQLFREQPFLVLLPAEEILGVPAKEEVLFQGFIDLLAVTERGVEIVDYKYSARTDADLRRHYAPQIRLYRKAAAKIMKIDERSVRAVIVNIQAGTEIPMD